MLKVLITSILITGSCYDAFCQKIVRNEVDEFTGQAIRETSFSHLCVSFKSNMNANVSLTLVESSYKLNLKLMLGLTVFSMDKDASFMIKLTDGEVIDLKNREFTVSCKGCGTPGFFGTSAQGTNTSYILDEPTIASLSKKELDKIRVYLNDGYVECKVNGDKNKAIIDLFNKINEK